MQDHVTEEMIGAYLDGELAADEHQLVEQQLASSAELRQILDELKGLRASFNSLPRFQLGPDFHQRVVAQIESAEADDTTKVVSASATRDAHRFSWQTVALAGISLVAVIVIALSVNFQAPSNGDSQFVQGPTEDEIAENELAWANVFQKKQQYVLVYDFTLTPTARRKQLFEKQLAKVGIALAPSSKLDDGLADDLVAVAAEKGVEKVVPYKDAPGVPESDERDKVELIYITARMNQVSELWTGLVPNPGMAMQANGVKGVMAFVLEPHAVGVLRGVHTEVGHQYAQTGGDTSRAYRLTLSFELVSTAVPGVATIPGLGLEGIAAPAGGQGDATQAPTIDLSGFSATGSDEAKKADAESPAPEDDVQAAAAEQDPISNVLVIVRHLSKEPSKNND